MQGYFSNTLGKIGDPLTLYILADADQNEICQAGAKHLSKAQWKRLNFLHLGPPRTIQE